MAPDPEAYGGLVVHLKVFCSLSTAVHRAVCPVHSLACVAFPGSEILTIISRTERMEGRSTMASITTYYGSFLAMTDHAVCSPPISPYADHPLNSCAGSCILHSRLCMPKATDLHEGCELSKICIIHQCLQCSCNLYADLMEASDDRLSFKVAINLLMLAQQEKVGL